MALGGLDRLSNTQTRGIILRVLEGLDRINWASINHAYGPANDVPGLLTQLLSKKEKVRSEAMSELYGNIWHQSTVYEATAYAVPFLIELLQSSDVQSRASIAVLLGLIARGRSFHEVHNPSKKAAVARELVWVKNARDAVRKGIEPYLKLISTDDQELRLTIVHLLACFPEDASQARQPILGTLAAESQPDARAALGLALALLGELRSEAFRSSKPTDLPLERLEHLARAVTQGRVDIENALCILLDLATNSFDPTPLDYLGIH